MVREFGWIVPGRIKSQELRLVAQLCDLIWSVHKDTQDIPYGLEYTRDARFNAATGALELGKKLKGLTCSTFVLAVFNTFNIQLLDLDSWESRAEDTEWQEWISDTFENPALAAESPCLRYRPEEVAGSCLCNGHPSHFEEAKIMGKKVLDDLTEFLVRRGKIT